MQIDDVIYEYNRLFQECIEGKKREYKINDFQLGIDVVALMDQCDAYPKVANEKRGQEIIVSLTTIEKRLSFVSYPIKCMLLQSMRPNRIVLWLDEKLKEKKLPDALTDLMQNGLEIRYVEDIGPHTKYFYALKEFEKDCVITIDDDMLYQLDMIEGLWNTHIEHPNDVCTYVPVLMKYTTNGVPYPIGQCSINRGSVFTGNMNLAQGVCGILYPPKCIDDKFFNKQLIRKLCLRQDDIWLYVAEYLSGTKVTMVDASPREYPYVDGAQVTALRFHNQRGGNDKSFCDIFEYFNLYRDFSGMNKVENESKTQMFMKWIQLLQKGHRISHYLEQNQISNVSIYGYGQLGKLLYEELLSDGIIIDNVIDKYVESTPVCKVKRNDEVDVVEKMLIITAPVELNYVKENVKCARNCKVISLMDIFVEMEYKIFQEFKK